MGMRHDARRQRLSHAHRPDTTLFPRAPFVLVVAASVAVMMVMAVVVVLMVAAAGVVVGFGGGALA